ncbi:MAG TPA: tRNA (adenosine(37)-N6)-threonylcarbamoyltransferase complex dimerization subunit type 1 TsaB [Candidatus Limnocylindrales bacterium]|nr:tRNA (adenosine(37)-N6)-threonylcarbamoyltransferase complex dimerization subunit type 1 TsaB [Candidatus Limnocylindrales bacterium]
MPGALPTLRGPLLAIDTATSEAVVALERPRADPTSAAWRTEQRHGEELLAAIDGLLTAAGLRPADLGGIVVGTGPGAFTGLRVGLATAKGLAHALGVPIIGVPTGLALMAGLSGGLAAGDRALLLPAGPRDRVLVDERQTRLLPAGTEPDIASGVELLAVDLEGRAPAAALALGAAARASLGASLLRLAAARLAAGDSDDLARLVPEYVSLPRGVVSLGGSIEWSRDPH